MEDEEIYTLLRRQFGALEISNQRHDWIRMGIRQALREESMVTWTWGRARQHPELTE